ncbi:DUF4365 domain-containing protein [Microcoleus sp. BR0-C5]|uniref:DUF4365 domain-containing protein n=1 Tax=Microcoleus sp. BR0-C5 TaxID=2818713 RepID=UPI002FD1B312
MQLYIAEFYNPIWCYIITLGRQNCSSSFMDINTQKEEFSYAYIYAVASAAGCICQRTTTPLDKLGVDLIITGIAASGLPNFPILYLQVKCTSRDILNENSLRYPLNIKNYEELSTSNAYPPRIIIVVSVPDRVNDWLQQTEAELCLKRCAYWISLEGASPTDNKETVTISIPRTNIFSAETLTTIMQRIATGRQL